MDEIDLTAGRSPGRPGASVQGAAVRAELAAVVRLALPVVVVQLGMMVIGVAETAMLGRVSGPALAAGALGNAYGFSLLMGAAGIVMALDPLVAQAHGAGESRAVGAHLQRGLVLAAALSVPLALLMGYARGPLLLLGQPPELVEGASAYLRGLIPGNIAFLVFVALRQTLQAMSVVRPAVVAIAIGNLVNLAASYALIFGRLGAPALGVVGAARAVSIGRWALALALLWAARPALAGVWHGFTREALDLRAHWQQLGIGVPIGIHLSLELWVFTAVALLMGRLGVHELDGHQVALTLAAVTYMVPFGIAAAAATRVGNAIGRRDMPGARRAAVLCLALGAGVMALCGLAFHFAPRLLASLFTDDPAIVAMGASLIPIAAVFQVFDGTQAVGAGVLRGAGDTRVPAAIALVGFWLAGLPLGAWLGLRAGLGPRGLWWGLTAGLATVALLLLLRIRQRFRGSIERVERVERVAPVEPRA